MFYNTMLSCCFVAAESLAPFERLEFDLPENFGPVFVEAKTQLQTYVTQTIFVFELW